MSVCVRLCHCTTVPLTHPLTVPLTHSLKALTHHRSQRFFSSRNLEFGICEFGICEFGIGVGIICSETKLGGCFGCFEFIVGLCSSLKSSVRYCIVGCPRLRCCVLRLFVGFWCLVFGWLVCFDSVEWVAIAMCRVKPEILVLYHYHNQRTKS